MGIDSGSGLRRAVFLDRDGVLNRNVWNSATGVWESPLTPEQFELLPKVIPALRLLRDAGYLLFLVSNQPNYAKEKATMPTLDAIHQKLERILAEEGISFAAYYYCYHHPAFTGACICRKPSPYFLLKARDTFGLSLEDSWMVGDRQTDVECGRIAGTRTVMIGEISAEAAGADRAASNLWLAAEVISNI